SHRGEAGGNGAAGFPSFLSRFDARILSAPRGRGALLPRRLVPERRLGPKRWGEKFLLRRKARRRGHRGRPPDFSTRGGTGLKRMPACFRIGSGILGIGSGKDGRGILYRAPQSGFED